MAAFTNWMENKLIDQIFRGQAYSFPATLYIGLFNTNPTDSTAGTEVSGTGYGRIAVTSNMSNWAGTQGAGTTTASTGTTGTTSNNAAITFGTPGAGGWSTINGVGIFDAVSGGNLLMYSALTTPKTVNYGDAAPSFAINALTFQIDTD